MLNFFRKHQRIFFLFITVVIVISFSFFGTFSTMVSSEQKKDDDILLTRGIEGLAIKKNEVQMLSRFLSSSLEDLYCGDRMQSINFLNDGVIEKDFLSTGLGLILVEKYFETLRNDLSFRLQRVRSYKPYVHPSAPFVSMQSAWLYAAPAVNSLYSELKQRETSANFETFAVLSQIYLQQKRLPPQALKKILLYQEQQIAGIEQDLNLPYLDLSLFGFHSLEDWFGHSFIELMSQFILNAAAFAESKGYKVSKEQARVTLLQNVQQGIRLYVGEKAELPDMRKVYLSIMQNLRMNEQEVVSLWQKVLLCRLLFEEMGNSVFLDPLMNEQFGGFAKEMANLEVFEMPSSFNLKDFRSLLKFQFYLDSIAGEKSYKNSLLLPTTTLSMDQIEKNLPEIVRKEFIVEVAEINKEKIGLQVSIKQMWDFETEEEGWFCLKAEFPILAREKVHTKQERFDILEKLDGDLRKEIDIFARNKILEKNPGILQQALKQAPVNQVQLSLSSKGGNMPFKGVHDVSALLNLLEKAAVNEESNPSQESLIARDDLKLYSQDGVHYYSISVIQKAPNKKVLTFAEVVSDELFEKALDKALETTYAEAKKKNPSSFQNQDKSFKPFAEVKDEVGAFYYRDILKNIELAYEGVYGPLENKERKNSLKFYATYRFLPYLKAAKEAVEINPEDHRFLAENKENLSLSNQWFLQKKSKKAARSEKYIFSTLETFDQPDNSWSSITEGKNGNLFFFKIISHEPSSSVSLDEVKKVQEGLKQEAKRELMVEIVKKIQGMKAIRLCNDREQTL